MAQDPRILNLTRNFRLKRKQAERAIENCACAWVEFGVSVRDLNPQERIAAINLQAAQRKLSPTVLGMNAELPGLRFAAPPSNYRAPREAYEEMDSPLGVRKCIWPRRSAEVMA